MYKQLIPFMLMEEDLLGGGGAPPATPPADAPPADTPPEIAAWLTGADPALIADPSMANIKDLDGLMKSYIHGQKMVGSEKMAIPNANSKPEEWLEAMQTLGLPKDAAEYTLNSAENTKLAPEFVEAFKAKAFEQGVLPKQAQGMMDFYEEMVASAENQHVDTMNSVREQQLTALKEEWGDGFQRNVAAANYAIDEFGGEELRTQLKSLGLNNDPQIIKMLSKVGLGMSEDEFSAGTTPGFGMTPDQAQAKMNDMLMDADHPLNNKTHANHKIAQGEYNKLAQLLAKK